ncbi:MAG: glycoside hydrolase family 31 protein [Kiritimatiellia bacterium]
MANRLSLLACAALLAAGVSPGAEMSVPLLPGEKWWGGSCGAGQYQPYAAEAASARYDLRTFGSSASPLLVSTKGRYLWAEKPFAFQFTNGTLEVSSAFALPQLTQAGRTLREAYLAAAKAHFRFDGRIPPEIFFTKPQWNNWIEIFLNGMVQRSVDDYTAELAQSGFPCGVYMMDGGWLSHQGSYEFYAKDYPDPKGMFDRINAQGWVPLIWTANFVSPDSREYKRLRYHPKLNGLDYLAYAPAPGKAAGVVRWWSGISCIYDLTKPAANAFYAQTLHAFADRYGIRGFKFDAGDPGPIQEGQVRFADPEAEGIDYTRLYAELAAREFPYHEIRVSWKCGGLPLVTRLPDRAHTWADQRTVIPQIVTAGLLGCPYAVGDMVGGGLECSFVGKKIDEKLVVRSAALHALMPMIQFSLAPWRHLSPAGVRLCREFIDLRQAHLPYLMRTVREAAQTGAPIVRAMEYEFPDETFTRSTRQFMLGAELLVAPVLEPDDSTVVELPAGRWRDDLGVEHVGPKTLALTGVPLGRLPRYTRLRRD